jgi:hypothetical protein
MSNKTPNPEQPQQSTPAPVEERRAFLGALGGFLGASVVAGCAGGNGEPGAGSPVGPGTVPTAALGTDPVRWVDTVDGDLRTLPGCVDTEVVVAKGFYATDDGGGGVFYWQSEMSPQDDGGTRIAVSGSACGTSDAGVWVRVYSGPLDVRWFGARAGSTAYAADNDAAIAAALAVATSDSGKIDAGRIFFPQGAWYISETINIHHEDSVILLGPGGAGPTGPAGNQNHYAAKLIWDGDEGGTMVELDSTLRCGIQGLCLDGGGTAGCALRVTAGEAVTKGNLVEDLMILNMASDAIGIHVGDTFNPDIAFNTFRHFWISGCEIGVLQQGNQTVHAVFEDGVLDDQLDYGMRFEGGDINVSRCFFNAHEDAVAEVYVARIAQYARFIGNTHETTCLTSYLFEPTDESNIRPMSTVFVGVRVAYKRSSGSPRRIIDYQQDGHLTLVGCMFDGEHHSPAIYFAPPTMPDTGLCNDIGSRFINGASVVLGGTRGAYTSLYSNSGVSMPSFSSIMGEHLMTATRLRMHNGELVMHDNNSTQQGIRMSTYLGQLFITSTETRSGAFLALLQNNGTHAMSVNHAGGPGFYGTLSQPAVKPTVTGSRGGNAALASLLTALAGFGLITDSST